MTGAFWAKQPRAISPSVTSRFFFMSPLNRFLPAVQFGRAARRNSSQFPPFSQGFLENRTKPARRRKRNRLINDSAGLGGSLEALDSRAAAEGFLDVPSRGPMGAPQPLRSSWWPEPGRSGAGVFDRCDAHVSPSLPARRR